MSITRNDLEGNGFVRYVVVADGFAYNVVISFDHETVTDRLIGVNKNAATTTLFTAGLMVMLTPPS